MKATTAAIVTSDLFREQSIAELYPHESRFVASLLPAPTNLELNQFLAVDLFELRANLFKFL
jgi:hypothetical protein